jgi:hypothetical protein
MMKKLQTLLHKLEDGVFAVHDGIVSLSGDRLGYLCILNGIIGDMLEARKSRLAIPMAFYVEGERLSGLPDEGKVCVLAHGSCTSEKDWGFQDNPSKDYGSLLQADLGYFPIYLRYNSGLHI